MSKSNALKTDATPVRVPQSREEAAQFIADIGRHQRERTRIETKMNDFLARIAARFQLRAKAHADAIEDLKRGLEIWAAAHRQELTDGGKTKTAQLTTGELRWRMTPPSCSLRDVKKVLAALKDKALTRFIRTKEEIDKEAILKEPAAVKGIAGIKIGQREEFVIVPNETKLEEVS